MQSLTERFAPKQKKVLKRSKTLPYRPSVSIARIRSMVREEIEASQEHKTVRNTANLALGSNPDTYTSFAANNVIDCSIAYGSIAQGAGQGNRIGNRIKLTKFNLVGSLYPQAVDQPQVVVMWVVMDKIDPYNNSSVDVKDACSILASAPGNSWFQDGNSVTGLTSNLRDLQLPINEDRFQVFYKKIFKVANAQAPQGVSPGSNNDFSSLVNYKIDLLKYMPRDKIIQYQDTYAAATFNRKLFVVFQCMNANGSTSTSLTAHVGHIRTFEIKWVDA